MGGTTRSPRVSLKGDRAIRGACAGVFATLGYTVVGSARSTFSRGETPTSANNNYMAVASHIWPGGRTNPELFDGLCPVSEFLDATVST